MSMSSYKYLFNRGKKWPHEKKIKIGSTHYYLGQITINLSPDLLKFKSIHCEHYLMHEKTEKMN